MSLSSLLVSEALTLGVDYFVVYKASNWISPLRWLTTLGNNISSDQAFYLWAAVGTGQLVYMYMNQPAENPSASH
jgi:hypothetical protein